MDKLERDLKVSRNEGEDKDKKIKEHSEKVTYAFLYAFLRYRSLKMIY